MKTTNDTQHSIETFCYSMMIIATLIAIALCVDTFDAIFKLFAL